MDVYRKYLPDICIEITIHLVLMLSDCKDIFSEMQDMHVLHAYYTEAVHVSVLNRLVFDVSKVLGLVLVCIGMKRVCMQSIILQA